MQTQSSPTYTVSPHVLAREDFQAACRERNFAEVFRLMRQYDGVSQDRMSSPIAGLGQSRMSRIMSGKERITSFDLILRIADSLHIPGHFFELAPRPWEEDVLDLSVTHDTPPAEVRRPVGELIDRRLSLDIDVAPGGAVTLNYRQELFNGSDVPFTRLIRELWFEHASGPLLIEAVPADEQDENARNLMIKKVHQSKLNAHYTCQVLPAVQPGESATIAYTCTGGQFVDAFYWRQSVLVPTDELRMRLTHRGIRQLTECAAIEERADGSELSVADSIAWKRTDDAVVVELVRKDLAVNQALLLRWDFARA